MAPAHADDTAHADNIPRAVFTSSAPFVLPVTVSDGDGQRLANLSAVSLGSGRFVSRCGELSGRFEAVDGAASRLLAVIARDPDSELCLLESPELAALPAAPTAPTPQAGSRVFALGNALGLGTGISEGVVSKLHRQGEDERIQFTAAIAAGSEGGGLFDAEGRLVGIIDRPLEGGQNVNLAVPAVRLDDIAARAALRSAQRSEHDALLARAEELRAARDWAGLREHAQAWVTRHPQDAEALRARAEAAEAVSELAAARADYRQALAHAADLKAAAFGLWRTQFALNDADALQTAQQLTESWPADVDAWISLSRSHAMKQDADAAERAARRALALQPWNMASHYLLGRLAQSRGDNVAWLHHQSAVWELAQTSPAALMGYVDALIANGRVARAMALIDAFPEHDSNGDLLYSRGLVLMAAKRPGDALITLRRSLEHAPSNPAWVWKTLGDVSYGLGMLPQAVDAYRKAVQGAPEQVNWRWALAVALKDALMLDEAMDIFSEWTTRWPDSPDGWRQTGVVLHMRGQYEQANIRYQRSLELDARQPLVWHLLVESYTAMGRNDDVRRAWLRLRELDPERAETVRLCCIVPLEVGAR
jgi:tetratricopeptide (TPR) repeat protein